MKTFKTFIIVNKKNAEIINEISFNNHFFSFSLIPDPSNQFYESIDWMSKSQIHWWGQKVKTIVEKDNIKQNELLINANNEEEATYIFSLIIWLIHLKEPWVYHFKSTVYEEKEEYMGFFLEKYKKVEVIWFAIQWLKKVFESDEDMIYAIEKYKIGIELDTYSLREFNPETYRWRIPYANKMLLQEQHTRSAFAIIACYATIEELWFELRSSKINPRFINWDLSPKVLIDIKKRLEEWGLPEDITYDWIFRWENNKLQDELKKDNFGKDSIWIRYWDNITDQEVSIPEAIHFCSYLRNKVAWHKFNEMTSFLTPYEVINCQWLARKLIIYKLWLWNS